MRRELVCGPLSLFVWCSVCLFGSRQRWLGGCEWPGRSRGGGRDAACFSLSYRTSSHGEYFLLTCAFGYAIIAGCIYHGEVQLLGVQRIESCFLFLQVFHVYVLPLIRFDFE